MKLLKKLPPSTKASVPLQDLKRQLFPSQRLPQQWPQPPWQQMRKPKQMTPMRQMMTPQMSQHQ